MKPKLRQTCCLVLAVSLLLQAVPAAMAQAGGGVLVAVRNELLEARRLLLEESGGKTAQQAIAPLDRAKKLAGGGEFAKAFSGKVDAFRRDLDKARLKVLWNDRDEALAIIDRLLSQLDVSPVKGAPVPTPPPSNPAGNGPGAGVMLGATLLAGLGAIILLFFTGQVSHR